MDRPTIHQYVTNELGKILVDKEPIKDSALMTALLLDKQDFERFFSDLQSDFGIVMPSRVRSKLSELPDDRHYSEMTLGDFVDVIAAEMSERNLLKR
jgi:hypothetical protein